MIKNGLTISAIVSLLIILALCGSVNAKDVIIESSGDLVIDQLSMSTTYADVSLAKGPNSTTFNVTHIFGVAAPADNYTWIINGFPAQTQSKSKYIHAFTSPGIFPVTLIAENRTWLAKTGTQAYDQNFLIGGVKATVPIEGNFINNTTNVPFQIEFNYTFNNSQYRGIPTNWRWEFYNSTGKFDTKETTSKIFRYNFPVLPINYTYTVNATAYNTSGYVTDNFTTHQVEVLTLPLILANFTASPETCPSFPVDVAFKDNSTGYLKVDAQYWDFNDTTYSSQINATHQYHRPGTYKVNYTAINNTYRFQNSTKMDVLISGLLANFTYEMNSSPSVFLPKQKFLVNFTNTSDGLPTNYLWNFGDGVPPDSPITLSFANHTYTGGGTYNVSLTVFKTCGGSQISNTTIRSITLVEQMITNYTYQPNSGTYPLPVQFTDTTSDTPIQWEWWLYDKDGTTLLNYTNLQNPSRVYDSPGKYRVKLHTVNEKGATGTKDDWIVLYEGISADFTADKTSGIFPLLVNFTDNSTPTGQATNWNWMFGDEKPGSTIQNPNHTYDRKGNFTVSLTAKNSQSSSTKTKGAFISVGTKITPDFTPKGLVPARAPFVVNFTDQSTPADELSGWQWTFPDGSHANNRTASHQFPGPGVYSVQLNVSSPYDSRSVTYEVNVTEIKVPVADFIFSPTTINSGEMVSFEDRSVGSRPLNWSWKFGDGGVSTEQYPQYKYLYAGQYYPSLTVANIYGENTKKSTLPISVRGPVIPSFTTDKLDWWSVINQPVTFIDTSKGQPVSWVWNFADGTAPMTVSESHVSHTYIKTGTFNVTMTATNWVGDTKTAFHSFEVTDKDRPRDVNFEVPGLKYSGTHPFTVQFNQTTPSQSNVIEWYWDFGDGTNYFGTLTDPQAQSPTHTYLEPGEYTVTLTVRNDVGVNEKIRVAYVVVV
jgi:PKD repeat protein